MTEHVLLARAQTSEHVVLCTVPLICSCQFTLGTFEMQCRLLLAGNEAGDVTE